MTTNVKEFYINATDVQFLFEQATFPTIKIVGYDSSGNPQFGYQDAGGTVHTIAVDPSDGLYHPADVIYERAGYQGTDPNAPNYDPRVGLPLYNGPRDFQGLRNVSGVFNNLIEGQLLWGATDSLFMRLVNPDYSHYLKGDLATDGASSFNSSEVTVTSETMPVTSTVTVQGVNFTATEWDQTVDRTDVDIAITSFGHHTTVDEGTKTLTTVAGEVDH
jgi:hypothetical protein